MLAAYVFYIYIYVLHLDYRLNALCGYTCCIPPMASWLCREVPCCLLPLHSRWQARDLHGLVER